MYRYALFVARHVYLDSLDTNVPAAHSLVLCCMFGPVGFLSHTLTKGLRRRTTTAFMNK